MRTLSATLIAAQKQASAAPYVRVRAKNLSGGVVNYKWSRLYSGAEDDYLHGVAMPSDGSMVRARVTPPADGSKLYYQRVAAPGPSSDFSAWTYAGLFDIVAVAAAALGQEVSIFLVQADRAIKRIKSADGGATWGSPEIIDYTVTTSVYGLAAAYKPGGDLALFFADQSALCVLKLSGESWQPRAGWDKTTGDLSGVACAYDGDWDLAVSGCDAAGNYRLWSLVYGDGGGVPAGTWSDLKDLASAPDGGLFRFQSPFVDKQDVPRLFFVEKYTGDEAYSRPFWSHLAPGNGLVYGLWREPVPFDLSSEYGLAMAHSGDYAWLTSPAGVWRASRAVQTLDLSADVVGAREELGTEEGKLSIELSNDRGQYASPGAGALAVLEAGCRIDFSPGYAGTAGNEASEGPSFTLDAFEHTVSPGKSALVLHASDGWSALEAWQARHQFRWNKSSDDLNVRDILAFLAARCGLKLEIISASSVATGFYPDFTISPRDSGVRLVRKLLSFVPDVLFIEGGTVYLVNPLASDDSVYSYGAEHPVLEGRYVQGNWEVNRAQVEGYEAVAESPVLADRFSWEQIGRVGERIEQVEDANLASVAEARQRGDAVLRKSEARSKGGLIEVRVNCGQQLYDVIEITDQRSGLSAAKRRVTGLVLIYRPERAEYRQRMQLGAP